MLTGVDFDMDFVLSLESRQIQSLVLWNFIYWILILGFDDIDVDLSKITGTKCGTYCTWNGGDLLCISNGYLWLINNA